MNNATRMNYEHPVRLGRRSTLLAMGTLWSAGLVTGDAVAQDHPKPDWSLADMPSQTGRIFLVTGGTSGMGHENAKALTAAGATVVIAARNPQRGEEAIARIRQEIPNAQLQFEAIDLADLASVRALTDRLRAALPRLDGLVNNAAIMAPPERSTSVNGLEMQFATNYAGHFVLTAGLLPILRRSAAPRVVTLSSIAVHRGRINFDDLQSTSAYDPYAAYAQSKLACLIFALELQRRSEAAGWSIQSMAAHPGVAVTELVARGPGLDSESGRLWASRREHFQTAAQGALPTLYAATAPQARGGAYYGPTGPQEVNGPLGLATIPTAASDTGAAARLWTATEELTGTRFLSRTG
ncbi:SDR family oxidoreductase [Muricoccus pecuniae]|uniref:NAD(P)-dependent dehydrogenase (Short-subunit alcohol dehydrogenase family) n=1 Tax=Muricoccus pecuniae TaxID=693023 RepID=A0A840Y6Q7_9PROT|nr:SDR family oxidoreductase [Roseomonas pecuniae]MBB5696425.1 NAD(P)-dependent dehydrogenase (short-subunit alcohol dehydrogenase family) [Roseomonas pecuniae]